MEKIKGWILEAGSGVAILNRVVTECLTEKMAFKQTWIRQKERFMQPRKSVLGRVYSKCKYFEVGSCPAHLRQSKKAIIVGEELGRGKNRKWWQRSRDRLTDYVGSWRSWWGLWLLLWVRWITEQRKGTIWLTSLKVSGWGFSNVQWPRLCTPNAGGPGLIPGQRTRSHMPQQR